MHIHEFPEIKKNNETVVSKTNHHHLINDFTKQVSDRGITCLSYVSNKKETQDMPSGLSFSKDFTPEDMMNIVLNYMGSTLSPRDSLLFVTQLQNWVITQMISSEDSDEDYTTEEN
jgi:hypothetical protein